ncbi:MAG TPA: hypothetical protein VMS98_01650 [Thermoanaerobaculia bacterium]|nr:hypothetical protein [Thermoanaerobaculia bacterium]
MTPTYRCAAVVMLLFVACKPAGKDATSKGKAAGPQAAATVVEVKTTLQPSKSSSTHRIVIAGDLARSTAESGSWRLFDLKQNRVVRVDDTERTFRSEPFTVLVEHRRAALAQTVDERFPRAEYTETEESRPMLGVQARQSVVTMGRYRRELWIGAHPLIPPLLFALMLASEQPSPLAPLQSAVDEGLLAARGFPLLDHAEVPVGKETLIVERIVTAVGRQEVPASMLQIPAGYRELPALTPPPRRPVARPAPPPPPATETTATTDTTATTETMATTDTTP